MLRGTQPCRRGVAGWPWQIYDVVIGLFGLVVSMFSAGRSETRADTRIDIQ